MGSDPVVAPGDGQQTGVMLPQRRSNKTSAAQTVLLVLAVILCCLVLILSAIVGRKLRSRPVPRIDARMEGSEEALKFTEDLDTCEKPGDHLLEKHCRRDGIKPVSGEYCAEDGFSKPTKKGRMPVEEDPCDLGAKAPARIFHQEPTALAELPTQFHDAGSFGRLAKASPRDVSVEEAQCADATLTPSPRKIGASTATPSGVLIEIVDENSQDNSPRASPTIVSLPPRFVSGDHPEDVLRSGKLESPTEQKGDSSPSCSTTDTILARSVQGGTPMQPILETPGKVDVQREPCKVGPTELDLDGDDEDLEGIQDATPLSAKVAVPKARAGPRIAKASTAAPFYEFTQKDDEAIP